MSGTIAPIKPKDDRLVPIGCVLNVLANLNPSFILAGGIQAFKGAIGVMGGLVSGDLSFLIAAEGEGNPNNC